MRRIVSAEEIHAMLEAADYAGQPHYRCAETIAAFVEDRTREWTVDHQNRQRDAALAALRLVPRGPGDHVAGCPAGIRTPQGCPPPVGQGACTCYVGRVCAALGEVT